MECHPLVMTTWLVLVCCLTVTYPKYEARLLPFSYSRFTSYGT